MFLLAILTASRAFAQGQTAIAGSCATRPARCFPLHRGSGQPGAHREDPDGHDRTLDEGSDLAVQLHMISSGAAEIVRPSIPLYFSATPPTRTPVVVKLESKVIDIPAGEPAYVVEDSYVLPDNIEVVSIRSRITWPRR